MRIPKFLLFLVLHHSFAQGQEMDSANQKAVSNFIDCIKYKKKEKLANNISYPLSRTYPVPDIKNNQEFVKRYAEIFDDSLSKIIANSQPSRDWSAVGSRGMMLLYGLVWLDYEDGRLIAVNYQSKIEAQEWKKLVRIEKANLHESIRDFKQPMCILETAKYRIRIDDLGAHNYRYSSWPLTRKMSEKPDLIIEKGKYIPEGSGGNGKYEFTTGEYTYDCSIIVMGTDDSPPAILAIYKNHKEILSQDATLVGD